jgi:hypothetical protein
VLDHEAAPFDGVTGIGLGWEGGIEGQQGCTVVKNASH